MPTILEQAEVIRDETGEYANTPERVGTCLVDIANALGLSVQNSASFCFSNDSGVCTTPCPNTDTRLVLIDGSNTGEFMFTVGNGVGITNSDGTFYFSGLTASKAYTVIYCLSFYYDSAANVAVGLRSVNGGLNGVRGALRDYIITGSGDTERKSLTLTASITGSESIGLVIAGGADTVFSLEACNATISELGTVGT